MTDLEDAWRWYRDIRRHTQLLARMARKHWSELPWEGPLGKDDYFCHLDPKAVENESISCVAHVDDFAVLLLFSVFEATIRDHAARLLRAASRPELHPLLRAAINDALDAAEHGGFYRVQTSYKAVDADLVEMVNQVRRYRNWVAHGRRGVKPDAVDPATAYDRLRRFLTAAGLVGEDGDRSDGGAGPGPDTLGWENGPST